MNDDIQHLRWLTIGHYIAAAMMAMFACIPIIHLSLGLIFLLSPPPGPEGDPYGPRIFGLIFALIGGALVLGGWTLAALIFAAGRSIKARKRRTFCFVVAVISCAIFPLGTALGIFSILVLSRPAVKAMFEPTLNAAEPYVPRPGGWRDESFDRYQ